MGDHEHLREVWILRSVLYAFLTNDLRLDVTYGGETPAGTGTVLILDRSNRVFLYYSELILWKNGFLRLGGQWNYHRSQQRKRKYFFHE